MSNPNPRQEQVTKLAQEVAVAFRGQLKRSSRDAAVAHRSEGQLHAWRFRSATGESDRYIRVAHAAMVRCEDVGQLMTQLVREKWEDRLFEGNGTSLVLSPAGHLKRHRA